MAPINATRLVLSNEGSDVTLFIKQGVPIGSLDTRNERYFWFHHTDGDTMAVESRDDLDRCTALWAGVAYALAAIDEQLPRWRRAPLFFSSWILFVFVFYFPLFPFSLFS